MRSFDANIYLENLIGFPSDSGQPEPPEFKQGETVSFSYYLAINGDSVKPEDWDVTAVLKKSRYNPEVTWTGTLNNGIYKDKTLYTVMLPLGLTNSLGAGTYWLDIVAKEKLGRSNLPVDTVVVLVTQPFYLTYTASSPNPTKDHLDAPVLPLPVDITLH